MVLKQSLRGFSQTRVFNDELPHCSVSTHLWSQCLNESSICSGVTDLQPATLLKTNLFCIFSSRTQIYMSFDILMFLIHAPSTHVLWWFTVSSLLFSGNIYRKLSYRYVDPAITLSTIHFLCFFVFVPSKMSLGKFQFGHKCEPTAYVLKNDSASRYFFSIHVYRYSYDFTGS